MWQHIHKLMEVPFFGLAAGKILEVGAGAGEHLPFVTQRFETYYQTDLDISLLGSTPPPPAVTAAAKKAAESRHVHGSRGCRSCN